MVVWVLCRTISIGLHFRLDERNSGAIIQPSREKKQQNLFYSPNIDIFYHNLFFYLISKLLLPVLTSLHCAVEMILFDEVFM